MDGIGVRWNCAFDLWLHHPGRHSRLRWRGRVLISRRSLVLGGRWTRGARIPHRRKQRSQFCFGLERGAGQQMPGLGLPSNPRCRLGEL